MNGMLSFLGGVQAKVKRRRAPLLAFMGQGRPLKSCGTGHVVTQ